MYDSLKNESNLEDLKGSKILASSGMHEPRQLG